MWPRRRSRDNGITTMDHGRTPNRHHKIRVLLHPAPDYVVAAAFKIRTPWLRSPLINYVCDAESCDPSWLYVVPCYQKHCLNAPFRDDNHRVYLRVQRQVGGLSVPGSPLPECHYCYQTHGIH